MILEAKNLENFSLSGLRIEIWGPDHWNMEDCQLLIEWRLATSKYTRITST
jgi:hypothetical protein